MTDFDAKDFLGAFLSEAGEHLTQATRQLLEVESALAGGRQDRRAVREAYRALHTIKGLAGMVSIDPIVDLAHAMEAVLRAADAAGGSLDTDRVDTLLRGVRAIEDRLEQIADQKPVSSAPRDVLDQLLDAELASPVVDSAPTDFDLGDDLADKLQLADRELLDEARRRGRCGFRVDFVPSAEKNQGGINITTIRERAATIGEIVRVLPVSRPETSETPAGLVFAIILVSDADLEAVAREIDIPISEVRALWPATIPQASAAPVEELIAPGTTAGFVRVQVSRLDDALEKLSLVVVDRFRLLRALTDLRARGVDVRTLEEIVGSGGRQLRELRGAIMRARMVPVAEFLERVPLIIRSLSRATGKAVRLDLDVGRAEVDKSVAERIFPAIVHLVRNAIDHGIEPPEERAASGKPESGVVKIVCRELGNARLLLRVEDDGRGIDRQQIADRAGRPVPETDAALLDLLRMPGLSTASRPSHTSGRGLGMDIVARIVSELAGIIAVASEPARGTAFSIEIPLSITIVDAFTLCCAERVFAVPVGSIEEVLEVEPSASSMIVRRGEVVPLFDLAAALHVDEERARKKALLVRRNDQPCAFAVDRMIGRQEVVIRPLEDPLVKVPGVSGATDLGDGRPTLVLDLIALSAEVGRKKEDWS